MRVVFCWVEYFETKIPSASIPFQYKGRRSRRDFNDSIIGKDVLFVLSGVLLALFSIFLTVFGKKIP